MIKITWELLKPLYFVRRNNRSPESYYLPKVKKITHYFSNKDFNQENVDSFLMWIRADFEKKNERPMSASYYNKYIYMIRDIGKVLHLDFVKDYEGKTGTFKETEKLTDEEFKRLLLINLPYSREAVYSNFRWRLIMKVLFITTQRPGNIRDLKREDLVNDKLYLGLTKNGKPHKARLPQPIIEEIYKLKRDVNGYLFGHFDLRDLNEEIKLRCEKAKINKNITCKSFRGSGISSYLKKAPIQVVARISNHKDLNVLYTHYAMEDDSEVENLVNHNSIAPVPLCKQDVVDEYRKITDKLRDTPFKKLAEDAERYILSLIPTT